MILVTGAAGKTGKAIIQALSKKNASVRALVYRKKQRSIAETCGAIEVVVGDMRDAEVFIHVMEGINKVYHICPNMSPFEIEIGKNALSTAQRAPVDQFVYHSVLHPQTKKMPHHWAKLQVEEMLLESNLPFTILQPTIYMQNLHAEWKNIVEMGTYSVPYSIKAKLSMVDLEDVAKAAACVLTEPEHLGATYELCGPERMSAKEVAKVLSEKLGREVSAEEKSMDSWKIGAKSAGLGEYQIDTLMKMFHYYDEFGFPGNDRVLWNLLGRSPSNFITFIEREIRARGIKV